MVVRGSGKRGRLPAPPHVAEPPHLKGMALRGRDVPIAGGGVPHPPLCLTRVDKERQGVIRNAMRSAGRWNSYDNEHWKDVRASARFCLSGRGVLTKLAM